MTRIIGVAAVGLSVLGAAPPLVAQQFSIVADAHTTPRSFGAKIGTRRAFICRPNLPLQTVWGTDVYTDDTAICSAAVHAGVIKAAEGGVVTIVISVGSDKYPASSRNGVESLAWTSPLERSYTFDRATPARGQIDWGTSAAWLPPDFHIPLDVECPPTDAKVMADVAGIYGSDVYTSDSPICPAALHAGLITFGGGAVHFVNRGAQKSFASTTRNGVTSRNYGPWDASFALTPAPALTADVSGPTGTPTRDRGFVPKSFTVTVTSAANGPVVTWPAVAQASGYAVSRWKIDDNCCDNSSGRTYTAVSPWQDSPLPVSGTYVYRVVANTPAGDVYGETQFGFRKPGDAVIATSPTTSPTTVTPVLVSPTPTTGTITPMPAGTTTTSPTGTLVTERPATNVTNIGAGPAPSNLRFTGVPPIVRIAWDPPAGVTSYNLNWKRAGAANWTLGPKPLPSGATDFDFRIEDPSQTYTYQVVANQADGRFGSASGDFKPTPLEPTGFSATAIAPGKVRFEWDNIQTQFPLYFQNDRPTTYLLAGPGTGTGIMVVGSSTSVTQRNTYELQDVPAGTQTWTLTPAWPAVISPSTSWAKATATVPAIVADPAPRYRLVALGFKAIQQSKDIDDAHDGHGDEVYFSAVVNRTQLTGLPLPVTKGATLTMVMTRSHGDEGVSVPYGRIRAGTASATGGIATGDVVPAGLDLAAPTGALQELTFPRLVWEGTLGPNDAIVIHPTLWEDDVNPLVHATWFKTLFDAASSGYTNLPDLRNSNGVLLFETPAMIRQLDSASRVPNAWITTISNGFVSKLRYNGQAGSRLIRCAYMAADPVPKPCEAHGVDRPIGLELDSSDDGFTADWKDRIILLTNASVKAALEAPLYPADYAAWPRGTFRLKFVDNPYEGANVEPIANYELFFRIEKLP
jgi:hypothetical protein